MSKVTIDLADIKRRATTAKAEASRLERLAMDIEFDQGLMEPEDAKTYERSAAAAQALSWTVNASQLNPNSLRAEDNMPAVKTRQTRKKRGTNGRANGTSWARASAANIAELMRGRPMSGVTWLTDQLRAQGIRASEGMVEKILTANPDLFQKRGRYAWGLVTK